MHRRLAKEFARIEQNYPNPLSEEEIYSYLKDFSMIVPQGSPMSGVGNYLTTQSVSNCCVIDGPKDNLSSILNTGKELANLYKHRFGVGFDLSNLRPQGASVDNPAKASTGAWSFSDIYSTITNTIGQQGRRGALMLTLSVKHPDTIHFARMKLDETKCTGANVSVRITDEFMEAVKSNSTFQQQWPVDSNNPQIVRSINAKELFEELVRCAQLRGDPGLLMWDNITKNLPTEYYEGFKTLSTNPCSEIPMCVDTCRLISINLLGFVKNPFTKDAVFDFTGFSIACEVATRLSDDLVDLEIEQLRKIIAKYEGEGDLDSVESLIKILNNAIAGRRTGLGLHALGDTLASLGVLYDSDDGILTTHQLYQTLAVEAYVTSTDLAVERGAPSIFSGGTKDENCPFIQRLEKVSYKPISGVPRRNGALLTTAPTGTVSLCSAARLFLLGVGGTSSGIESILWLESDRYKKMPHDSIEIPDRIDKVGVKWKKFNCFHPAYAYWLSLPEDQRVSKDVFRTVGVIDPLVKVRLIATAQQWVDHGISCTINCPRGTDKQQIHDIYLTAWKAGLKGITVYVEGSRETAVIESKSIKEHHAPKRPKELPCDIHRRKIEGCDWTVLVGLLDGQPYELFCGKSDDISIGTSIKSGTLRKGKVDGTSKYDLLFQLRNRQQVIEDVVRVFDNKLYMDQSRLVSMSLRHGVPLEFIADQLLKAGKEVSTEDADTDMNTFAKVIARVVKSYIKDGTKTLTTQTCSTCGSTDLVFQSGCVSCNVCMGSKCQ